MTYGLTSDEKRFLFNKHKDSSYKEVERFQKELKKLINNNKIKEAEYNKNLDTEFKKKFKELR